MWDSIAKENKWGKKCLEIMSIKGGGGPTLNGKFHFKFPFCFSDYLPYKQSAKRGGGNYATNFDYVIPDIGLNV